MTIQADKLDGRQLDIALHSALGYSDGENDVPAYSSDWGAMKVAINEMRDRGWDWSIHVEADGIYCHLNAVSKELRAQLRSWGSCFIRTSGADNLPTSVARAALDGLWKPDVKSAEEFVRREKERLADAMKQVDICKADLATAEALLQTLSAMTR